MKLARVFSTVTALAVFVNGQASQGPSSDPYSCSATKPCSIGCCSSTGVCGLGPEFCGSTCISSCDYKSECDPGWGSQWSKSETCPLNVCCSKFGFCGTTTEFCGNKTVTKPSCSGTSSNKRSIGYYEGWSTTRACNGMSPETIPAGAYTHLNYAFAFIDPTSYHVAPMSDLDVALYPRFTGIKDSNPGLETWISVGGWSMNDLNQPTASTFSNLAGSSSAQASFFGSLISFMQTYGFDGVDIDWEYPVAPERAGNPADYQNYVSFLKNLKSALGSSGHKYGLTITVPSSYWYMQNFDLQSISKIVDWFNVMTYDLHGTWDSTDRFIGPIVNAHTNLTEIDLTMDLFWRNKIDPDKIVMGLGFYGRSFTLSNPSCNTAGCGFSSGGKPGPCSASAGTLMSSEIQTIVDAGAVPVLDKVAAVKTVTWDTDQWVSYDDVDTFKLKIDYANGKCLGGTMVWAVSTDDGNYTSAAAFAQHNGLSQKSLWGGTPAPPVEVLTTCVWGDCNAECPSGLSAAQRSDGKNRGNAGIYAFCPDGQTRNYCCPSNQALPTCQWRGTAPFCGGQCHSGEVEVSSDSSGGGHECWTGHKVLCCTSTQSDAAIGQCKWEGAAPFCGKNAGIGQHYGCDESDRYEETYDSLGASGESYCLTGYKSFCCTKPPPFQNCAWSKKDSPWLHPFTCPTGCGPGKQIIAQDPTQLGFCDIGSSYYCCDAPTTTLPDDQTALDFCVPLDSDFVLTGEYDDDGNPADLVELYWYENDVFVIPNDIDPDVAKRSLNIVQRLSNIRAERGWVATANTTDKNHSFPEVCVSENDCFLIHEDEHPEVQSLLQEIKTLLPFTTVKRSLESSDELVKRARVRAAQLRLPKNRRTKFIAASYNTVAELVGKGRSLWSTPVGKVAKNICLKSAASFAARQLGTKYVTEHMTELQTPAQFAQSLVDSKYPDTTTPVGIVANYDWEQLFGDNGYIHMTWTQLGVARPAGLSGDTPIDSIYRAFGSKGSDGDDQNLLVCDARTNSLKTSAWAVHSNIIGTSRWNKATPRQRMVFINLLDQSLAPYMNSAEGQAALKHGYDAQQAVWKALDQAINQNSALNGPGPSIQLLHKEWYQRFFYAVNANMKIFYQAKLQSEITNWSGKSKAYAAYQAVQRQKIVSDLQGRSAALDAVVVLTAFIT